MQYYSTELQRKGNGAVGRFCLKSCAATAHIIALAALVTVQALAVTVVIDARLDPCEWYQYKTEAVITQKDNSNCGIEFGSFRFLLDEENNAVYFAAEGISEDIDRENKKSGVAVSLNGGDFVSLTGEGTSGYDKALYGFEHAVRVDTHNGFTCEAKMAVKNGLPGQMTLGIRYIDGSGVESNVHYIVLRESAAPTEPQEPTEMNEISQTSPRRDPTAARTTKSATQAKPSVTQTQKETSARATTARVTAARTTRARTTRLHTTSPFTTAVRATENRSATGSAPATLPHSTAKASAAVTEVPVQTGKAAATDKTYTTAMDIHGKESAASETSAAVTAAFGEQPEEKKDARRAVAAVASGAMIAAAGGICVAFAVRNEMKGTE